MVESRGNWGEHEGSWLSIWFGDRDMDGDMDSMSYYRLCKCI